MFKTDITLIGSYQNKDVWHCGKCGFRFVNEPDTDIKACPHCKKKVRHFFYQPYDYDD